MGKIMIAALGYAGTLAITTMGTVMGNAMYECSRELFVDQFDILTAVTVTKCREVIKEIQK